MRFTSSLRRRYAPLCFLPLDHPTDHLPPPHRKMTSSKIPSSRASSGIEKNVIRASSCIRRRRRASPCRRRPRRRKASSERAAPLYRRCCRSIPIPVRGCHSSLSSPGPPPPLRQSVGSHNTMRSWAQKPFIDFAPLLVLRLLRSFLSLHQSSTFRTSED